LEFPLALQRRLITLILSYVAEKSDAISFEKVEDIRRSIAQTMTPQMHLYVTKEVRFVRTYNTLHILNKIDEQVPIAFSYQVDTWPTSLVLPDGAMLTFQMEVVQTNAGDDICIDPTDIKMPLRIRNRKSGDKIALPGMSGRKSVKKLFMEQNIPSVRREQLPIICDALDRPLWIPGVRSSVQVDPHKEVGMTLHIHYLPNIE
jgi:tRNA(Ile)-lysidine synthase